MRVLSVTFIVFVVQSSSVISNITKINAYHHSIVHPNTPKLQRDPYQISTSGGGRNSKNDKRSGNVIFNDSFAFSSSSDVKDTSGTRNTRNLVVQKSGKESYSPNLAGGFLQNHRLEETLSPEVSASAAAAGVASSHFLSSTNLKLYDNDDSSLGKDDDTGVVKAAADASQQGIGRSVVPFHGSNGWASHSGSCLFSCGGFGGSSTPCCQLNYIQCCPNPQHEQINFKNLHHGRGYFGGGIGKGGYAWGAPPYNPPPIVRPKPCYNHHHHQHDLPYNPPPIIPNPGIISPPLVGGGGGSIIHKGIETLKYGVHNIGQLFKDHVGGGWTSGGNGAAGYYYHRRSDKGDETLNHDVSKKRFARSVHKRFDHVAVPCPVYSAPPSFGWPVVKPQSVGLGSLIGWTKPGVQQFHGGYFGGGGSYDYQHGTPNYAKGFGWGTSPGQAFRSSLSKCCKGPCHTPPQHIF